MPAVNRESCLQIEASTHLHARTHEKSVFLVLNCQQATLITGTIMMFPASCLDTQRILPPKHHQYTSYMLLIDIGC